MAKAQIKNPVKGEEIPPRIDQFLRPLALWTVPGASSEKALKSRG